MDDGTPCAGGTCFAGCLTGAFSGCIDDSSCRAGGVDIINGCVDPMANRGEIPNHAASAPSPWAVTRGDPHYKTFDKKRFDFQGCGTYWLIHDPINSFFLQSRQYGTERWIPGASLNGQIALQIEDHVLSFSARTDSSDVLYQINNEIMSNDVGTTIIPNEGSGTGPIVIKRTRRGPGTTAEKFLIEWNCNKVRIKALEMSGNPLGTPQRFFNVAVQLAPYMYGDFSGLLGTWTNSQQDDFLTKQGTLVSSADEFGYSWRVDALDGDYAMFTSEDDEHLSDDYICDDGDQTMTLEDLMRNLPEGVIHGAHEACANAPQETQQDCFHDALVIDDRSIVDQPEYQPACFNTDADCSEQGDCVEGVCICDEGFYGEDCFLAHGAASVQCGDTITGSTVGASNMIGNMAGEALIPFTVEADTWLTISSCGSDFDTWLRVWDKHLTEQLCHCDDCGDCGNRSVLDCHLPPGDYLIVVDGYSNKEGMFELEVTCGFQVGCGDSVTGSTYELASQVGDGSGEAHIPFSVEEALEITVSSCNSDFDTWLRVWNAELTEEICHCDDCGACGTRTVLDCQLPPGDYVIVVDGYQEREGNYEIEIACTDSSGCNSHDDCDGDSYCNLDGQCWTNCAECTLWDNAFDGWCPDCTENPAAGGGGHGHCTAHSDCDGDAYCDAWGNCWAPCEDCAHWNDAIDDECPHCEADLLFFAERLRWPQAENHCLTLGRHLVKVDTAARNNQVREIFEQQFGNERGARMWIGGSDQENEGTFTWVQDGAPFADDDFQFWGDSEPNNWRNRNEDCVNYLNHPSYAEGPMWNDEKCRKRSPFLCGEPIDGAQELSVHHVIACEWTTFDLYCPAGQAIEILYANYGRTADGDDVCPHPATSDQDCHSCDGIIRTLCEGESTCSMDATNYNCGDPCVGTFKYAEIEYRCAKSGDAAPKV